MLDQQKYIKMADCAEKDEEMVETKDSKDMEDLASLLGVPQDTIQALASSDDYRIVLEKVVDHFNSNSLELEEYTATIRQFSENLDVSDVQMKEKDRQNEELTDKLQQEATLREELQRTISSYALAEIEWKEKMESGETELEEQMEQKEAVENELQETKLEVSELGDSLQSKRMELEESEEQNQILREELQQTKLQLETLMSELTDTKSSLQVTQERVTELSVPPPEVPGADRQELLRMLDRRQHEISRLADEWKNMSSQLEITSAKKSEFQTRLDELVVQEASFRLKEQLLQQEKHLIKSQNEWLSTDLQTKSEQLLTLRKEKASSVSGLETRLTQKEEEAKHLSSVLNDQRKANTGLEKMAEEYLKRMKTDKEEMATLEEQLRKELSQQAKLTELYRHASEDSENRVKEVLSGIESLESLVKEVSQEKEQLQAQLEAKSIRYETVEKDLSTSIASQKEELDRANELLTSLRQRGSTFSDSEVLSLSPAAAKASALLKSGKTLTQIYSEHVKVCEELELGRQENRNLNNYIEQIVQELSEKTPALQKLRRDYEASVHSCSTLTQKLNAMYDECATLRLESEDSVKLYKSSQRENQRLKVLTSDLGRQVKVLLKECEEVRGGVASTSTMSHDYMDTSSGDISSSSMVISQRLVEFRNIEELQERNQQLLRVVRELSDQNEERERQTVDERTKELKAQLDTALEEVKDLQESRERQTEIVKSIVNQRDMYRTLLAQSTPLPPETSMSTQQMSELQGDDSVTTDSAARRQSEDSEIAKEFKELKEQFEAYRKEKVANDEMLRTQVEETREQCSSLRMDNAKLSSKLENANDRYQLLTTQASSHKRELEILRARNLQLSNALASHESTMVSTTQRLLSTQEKLVNTEVSLHTLKAERDMLEASERRARNHYEDLLREQRGHSTLLTNLQSIQNNLERSEFETKTRLGAQIEGLERDVALFKDRLHSEEDRRIKMADAYETQVRDLESRLSSLKEAKYGVDERLKNSEEEVLSLQSQLDATKGDLEGNRKELQEMKDKVLRLEDDAGSEFRGKIRLLERQLGDSKVKVQSLEVQLESAKKHEEQYKEMSLGYETQLQELNEMTEKFKNQMEEAQASSKAKEQELTERVEQLEEGKKDVEEQLQTFTEERAKQVSDLESQLSLLESDKGALQLELSSAQEELQEANQNVKIYTDSANEMQTLYQRELTQHGKSMELLLATKDQLQSVQEELSEVRIESLQLSNKLATTQGAWEERETHLSEECTQLEARASDLLQQNTLLHQEAEKLSARVLTLQEQQSQTLDTSGSLDTSGPSTLSSLENKSSEQLWEIIRYVRREKEIATTKQEMAESENNHQKQLVERLQRKLSEAEAQLKELSEAAQLHSESAAQHDEILAKVETLNVVTDSNKLLREERDRLAGYVKDIEAKKQQLESDMIPLRESNKQLTAQKDALVAEKTALRNEVQRWNTRTNQLIEQYNKIDPEEYKKLLEERDSTSSRLVTLREELDSLRSQLASAESARESLRSECTNLKDIVTQTSQEKEGLADEIKQLQTDVASKQDDIQAKTVLVGKLRDVGRKFRHLHEGSKKEVEELKTETTELKKKLEEAQASSESASALPPPSTDDADKTKELEEAQSTIEGLRTNLQQSEEKYNKIVKTVKVARSRIQALTTDKDKASKEAESANTERDELKSEMEGLQQQLNSLREKYDLETTKLKGTINKLQQALKERGPRRKVVPPSIPEGSQSLVQSTAPTAAVRPTVTTTPTASIRPMAMQTTTCAPTAHVTPTMVTPVVSSQLTNQMSLNSANVSSMATPAATVFLRTSSPQIVTPLPTTSMVSSSVSIPSTTAVGIARASSQVGRAVGGASGEEPRAVTKRQREEDSREAGTSSTLEPPARKRKKPLQVQRLKQRAVEVAASSSLAPDTQGEREALATGGEGQASESQVLAAESQSPDLPQSQNEEEETIMSVVPETDLDTQSTVASHVSGAAEAMQLNTALPESVVESREQAPSEDVGSRTSPPVIPEEDTSQVVSEMPTQMTQVTQSQEAAQVGKSDSTDEYVSPPSLSIKPSQVTSQEPSVTVVESMGKETQAEMQTSLSSEAATMAETMSSEAEMVRRKSVESREVSLEPSVYEIERQASTDVSGSDSQPTPAVVDSSEPSSVAAGVPSELDRDTAVDTEPMDAVSELREESREVMDEREGDDDEVVTEEMATLGQADTTQRVQGEGSRRGTSEPLSENMAEEGDERTEVCVEEEADDERTEETEPGTVEVEAGDERTEGGVESGNGDEEEEMEEREEFESSDGDEYDEEEEEEEEESESEEGEEFVNGTQMSPIVIDDSDTGSSSGDDEEEEEEEEEEEFAIRVDVSDQEEVDSNDSEDDDENVSDRREPSPQDDESCDQVDEQSRSRDQVDGSHEQSSSSHDQDQYQQEMPSTAGFELDLGLPEDETSVDIAASSMQEQPARPTFIPTVRRLQTLQFAGERPTTAVTPGFEGPTEDSVVPHTPVLNEGKQLSMTNRGQTIPSTPSERPSHAVPQIVGSSLTTESLQASGAIQSLGESHIELGPAIVPPPSMDVSHDPRSSAQFVGSDGDINDIIIDDIVGEDSSSSEDDIEDGQLEEEDVEQDEQLEPASTTTTLTGSHPHTSSTLIATSGAAVTTVSSISEQVSSVMVASGDMDDDDPPPTKRKPQPIVWGQPSSSSGVSTSGSSQRGSSKRKINIVRRVGQGSQQPPPPPPQSGGRRGAPRFKAKPQK